MMGGVGAIFRKRFRGAGFVRKNVIFVGENSANEPGVRSDFNFPGALQVLVLVQFNDTHKENVRWV
jgi:hypothetical protein